MSRKYIKIGAALFCCMVLLWLIIGWMAAAYVLRPAHQTIAVPDGTGWQPEILSLKTEDNIMLRGWYIPPRKIQPETTAVVLLSCLRGNRQHLLQRINFYHDHQFAVLAIDQRGTGESEGRHPSFGWNEKKDVQAVRNFLIKKKHISGIAFHGISAGAAAVCFAAPALETPEFIILESCYPQMRSAVFNRIHSRYRIPKWLFWPVIWACQIRFNGAFFDINPIDFVQHLNCPTFVIAGTDDPSIKQAETRLLFSAITGRKKLWLVPGLGHTDFMRHRPEQFKRQLISFLHTSHQNKERL
jgi:pimeloyl-ACP methyl ester carboxylesterase